MKQLSLSKIFNWEYWPSYMFYVPNLPYAFYLAFKAKSPVFFSAANPVIKHSGNGTESKFETLKLIPDTHKPKTIFVKKNSTLQENLTLFCKSGIEFPVIVKPDIGFRGLLVERIENEENLTSYLKKHSNLNILIQEFVSFKNECGIFYHKIPNEKKGRITSITLKKYLTITGNGKSTLIELIKADKRAEKYTDLLLKLHKQHLNIILKNGENKVLNVIGNHSKGTQFLNGNHLISKELEEVFDELTSKIPNWFYGRFDIKYNSFEELISEKKYTILELNGIISEPTHIYDTSKISYFKALKEIRKHWKILYKIAKKNHTVNKVTYDTTFEFLKSLQQLKSYTREIKKQSSL